jgi:hypothetical protein
MEPEWMRKIPSSTICDFFYTFYIVFAVFFVFTLATTVISFFHMKKFGLAGVLLAIQGLVIVGLAATKALFNYLICDRALLGKEGFGLFMRVAGCGQL